MKVSSVGEDQLVKILTVVALFIFIKKHVRRNVGNVIGEGNSCSREESGIVGNVSFAKLVKASFRCGVEYTYNPFVRMGKAVKLFVIAPMNTFGQSS